jgi:hypothetical protein
MAIDRNLLVPLDTIQAEFRGELGRFVDAFNALVATYVALQFATLAEINAGTEPGKAISPAGLAEHLNTQRFTAGTVSGGEVDGTKAPRLTAVGRLDSSFLSLATAEEMAQGQNGTVLVTALSFAVEVSARITAALSGRFSVGPGSAGPSDQGRAPVLNEDGKLDSSYLIPVASLYVGAMNATLPGGGLSPPIINGSNLHQIGNYTVVMVGGTYDLTRGEPWPTGVLMGPLDVLYFNGSIWERIPNPMAIEDFMRTDGSTAMTGNLMFAMAGRAVPNLRITGAIIECGTF